MHVLQPKHTKLKPDEVEKLLSSLNISPTQLPKIKVTDPALPKDCKVGDIVKIERLGNGRKTIYYRVVAV